MSKDGPKNGIKFQNSIELLLLELFVQISSLNLFKSSLVTKLENNILNLLHLTWNKHTMILTVKLH